MCGMIVAIFEHEPYALFMTAQHVFSNIEQGNSAIGEVEVSGLEPGRTGHNTAMFTSLQANATSDLLRSQSSRITDLLIRTHQMVHESSLALAHAFPGIQASRKINVGWVDKNDETMVEFLNEAIRLHHCLSGLLGHLAELAERALKLDPRYLEDQLGDLKQLLHKINRDIYAFQAANKGGKRPRSFGKYWRLKWKRHTEILQQWPLPLSTGYE